MNMLCDCSQAESVKGRVPNIRAAMMTPEMSPKTRIVFFHRLILLISFQIPGVNIAAAAWSVVILSGEFRLFRSKSYFGVRAKSSSNWLQRHGDTETSYINGSYDLVDLGRSP